MSNVDHIFFPVAAYLGLVTLGPWGIGYFLDDEVGVLFAWGMWVNGTWLPTYSTLIHTYWFLAPFWFIMMAGVTWMVANKYEGE